MVKRWMIKGAAGVVVLAGSILVARSIVQTKPKAAGASPTVETATEESTQAQASESPAQTDQSASDAAPAKKPQVPRGPMTPDQLFATASPAVVLVEVRDARMKPAGVGSGFFVSKDGLLVTNFHVIRHASFASIQSAGGPLYVEGVVATDAEADLALLQVRGGGKTFLKLSESALPKVGTKVYAIGNPRGLTNTLSDGLVSGLRQAADGPSLIQTTAAISPGSSGGPLLTSEGNVVGVTSATLTEAQNVNFAVAADAVRKLVKSKGKLKPLASASADSMGPADASAFEHVWAAIDGNDLKRASSMLEGLRQKHEGNPFYWFTSGILHERLNNFELSAKAHREAIRLRPTFYEAQCYLGFVLGKQGKVKEALDTFGAAEALNPKASLAPFYAGMVHLRTKNFGNALGAMERAIAADASNPDYHTLKGRALSGLKMDKRALESFKKALELEPDHVDAQCSLGDFYLERGNRPDAMSAFNKAIETKPDHAYAYFGLGTAAYQSGDKTEALIAWQNASRFDPHGQVGDLARRALVLASGKPAPKPATKPPAKAETKPAAPAAAPIEIKRKK